MRVLVNTAQLVNCFGQFYQVFYFQILFLLFVYLFTKLLSISIFASAVLMLMAATICLNKRQMCASGAENKFMMTFKPAADIGVLTLNLLFSYNTY